MTELPFRRSGRALLLAGDRVLLAEHRTHAGPSVWVGPGGVEGNESLHEALAREVFEETGLRITGAHRPRLVWVQTEPLAEMHAQGFAGVINHYFVLNVAMFDPASGVAVGEPGHPGNEGILNQHWWTLSALDVAHRDGVLFSPRDFPTLLRILFKEGPPHTPNRIGQ
ncbi:NUDIX domain-containing protein [Mycolicibacterium frederiksbergense]|uniref:NUDIX domain-containing protein n=1 Tax=Mycolicibacterium frederiksbergense TaxID=117567 RepID=UPI00399A2EA9